MARGRALQAEGVALRSPEAGRAGVGAGTWRVGPPSAASTGGGCLWREGSPPPRPQGKRAGPVGCPEVLEAAHPGLGVGVMRGRTAANTGSAWRTWVPAAVSR